MAPTKAVYHDHGELRTLKTHVTAVEPYKSLSEGDRSLFKQTPDDDAPVVTTAETIFYAQGGGQPSDTGAIKSMTNGGIDFEVSTVRKGNDGNILHLGTFTPRGSAPFSVGDEVEQTIDAAKRDLHSRLHTAGHVLGVAVRRVAEHVPEMQLEESKASHYPNAASVEFIGLIDGKHKAAIQEKCDELVRQALPVEICECTQAELKEKCEFLPDEFVNKDGGLTRVVDIVGAGGYPCGGTHVTDTSLIGSIQVRKISRQKGVSKVSYSVN